MAESGRLSTCISQYEKHLLSVKVVHDRQSREMRRLPKRQRPKGLLMRRQLP